MSLKTKRERSNARSTPGGQPNNCVAPNSFYLPFSPQDHLFSFCSLPFFIFATPWKTSTAPPRGKFRNVTKKYFLNIW